jgi:hypothetical protein
MVAKRLKGALDAAAASVLADPALLAKAYDPYRESLAAEWRVPKVDRSVVSDRLALLSRKYSRILEAFVAGAMGKAEGDRNLASVDAEIRTAELLLGAGAVPETLQARLSSNTLPPCSLRGNISREKRNKGS